MTEQKIRVLLADDSFVVRRVLQRIFEAEADLEVVGAAKDGLEAVRMTESLKPDLVVLDIEMPNMNGLEALTEIKKLNRALPVIMFSTLTERGARITVDALTRGANDYSTKPTGAAALASAEDQVRADLVPKIRAHARVMRTRARLASGAPQGGPGPHDRARRPESAQAKQQAAPRARKTPAEIVAIGISTGGPNALTEFVPKLPATFPVPIVVVQHMPAMFTKLLAERLDARSPLKVREAADGDTLSPGGIWIAPGDFHMTLTGRPGAVRVGLNKNAPENSCRPAVDPLFRSVAEVFQASALGLVMTGMGHDGLVGSRAIREAGGQIVVQDEASSVIWGMPGAVAEAGLADREVALDSIPSELLSRVRGGTLKRAG